MRKRLENGDFAPHIEHIAKVVQQQLGGYMPPPDSTEITVAAIFGELFGIDSSEVSATTSFFDFGGTSLEILKLTRMLAQRFQVSAVSFLRSLRSVLGSALSDPASVAASARRASDTYDSPRLDGTP
jgi:hypothetical protein